MLQNLKNDVAPNLATEPKRITVKKEKSLKHFETCIVLNHVKKFFNVEYYLQHVREKNLISRKFIGSVFKIMLEN